MKRLVPLPLLAVFLSACASDPVPNPDRDRALQIAQEFVDGYYHQFPEEAFEIAYTDAPLDALGLRSVADLEQWQAREDRWLSDLQALDPAALEGTDGAIPYVFTLDRLEASRARRVCKTELWKVSATSNGWQAMLSSTFAVQPVETQEERALALARLERVPAYLDTEIVNLKKGTQVNYLAAVPNVRAVLRQLDGMLAGAPDASPFLVPGTRSNDADFKERVREVVDSLINPAIKRYRDFLATEYKGRSQVGVDFNPGGAACYAASVRYHTSLDLDARTIHDTGLAEMERIQGAMREIALGHFGTDHVGSLLQRFRTDPAHTFRTEDEILAYARSAVSRGEKAVHDWFGFVPDAEIVVRPFPAYQKASGGGYYSAGTIDGTRPGTYELGTYLPETISKVGLEATAFHESYPGHHLQMSVALRGKGVHPILQYVYVASMAEGWGLYAESLADEMGLYSSEMDRMGMLSNQALRAARLVVDPGMHVLGWTRERAVEYMLANTAENRASVESEVDRYLATPGQATAYMIGSLEIQRLRAQAQASLGTGFDIKEFHDTVLADGAVSLPMLRRAVEEWVESRREIP